MQKASQTKFLQSRIKKLIIIHVQFPLPKREKTKKWEKFSGLQNGAIRGLQIGKGFRDYKLGQGFQIEAKRFEIGAEITNRFRRVVVDTGHLFVTLLYLLGRFSIP